MPNPVMLFYISGLLKNSLSRSARFLPAVFFLNTNQSGLPGAAETRSEERRGGKECIYRWEADK